MWILPSPLRAQPCLGWGALPNWPLVRAEEPLVGIVGEPRGSSAGSGNRIAHTRLG